MKINKLWRNVLYIAWACFIGCVLALWLGLGCAPRIVVEPEPDPQPEVVIVPEPQPEPEILVNPSPDYPLIMLYKSQQDARQIACDIAQGRIDSAFTAARMLAVYLSNMIEELFPDQGAGGEYDEANLSDPAVMQVERNADDAFNELESRTNE